MPLLGSPWRVDDVAPYMQFLFERCGEKNFDQLLKKFQELHCDSPDRYQGRQGNPFYFEAVILTTRVGWRWCTSERCVDVMLDRHGLFGKLKTKHYFETNWLYVGTDPSEEGRADYEYFRRTLPLEGPFAGMLRPPSTLEGYEECISKYEADCQARNIEIERRFAIFKAGSHTVESD